MRSFSAVLNILQEVSLSWNWDLNNNEYMKIFSWMLYIILKQQWIFSIMMRNCQWSSRSHMILKWIAADSELIIAENVLETSINKKVWIASILSNWKNDEIEFWILHTKKHRETAQKWISRNAKLSAYINSFWQQHTMN